MESPVHGLPALFRQLGLDDSPEAIHHFVTQHAPLSEHIPLAEAPCWTAAQTQFLEQAKADDADWAELVDELDLMLRGPS
jgi:hypothetical protein